MSRDHCMGSALTPCTSQRHMACGAGEGIRFVSLSYAFATARPSHSSNVVVGGWVACPPGVHWGAGHEARRDGALEPRDPGWNRLEIHKEAACARGSDLARKPRRAAGRAMNSEARGARERGSGGEGVGAVSAPKIMMGSRSIGMTLMATYVRRERARERLTPPTGTAALAFWDKKGTPSLPFGIRRKHPPSLLRLQGKHPPSLLISQGNEGGWSAPITGSKHLFGREGDSQRRRRYTPHNPNKRWEHLERISSCS